MIVLLALDTTVRVPMLHTWQSDANDTMAAHSTGSAFGANG